MSLLLLPATKENLKKSIEQSVDISLTRFYLPDTFVSEIVKYSGIEGIRCWAMTKNRANVFNQIAIGDEVLLSEKNTGLFNFYGIVVGKIISVEFGQVLWPFVGENPWENIFFLANIARVAIPKGSLVEELGYAKNFAVQGPMIVADANYSKLGSVSKKFDIPVFDRTAEVNVDKDFSGENVEYYGTRRVGHSKFSKDVKTNYNYCCAVCGITEVEFLISSHISPWSEDANNRLNPSNGICLCPIHDRAFEHGYIGFNEDFQIILNSQLSKSSLLYTELKRFEGRKMTMPAISPPDKKLLEKHRIKNNLA